MIVVGGDHLRREGNLGREFNCRKEIPDPDATIFAADPVLAEVGGLQGTTWSGTKAPGVRDQ